MPRIRIFLLTLLIVALPSGAFATPTSVDISPPNPAVDDLVLFETTLTWSTGGFFVSSASPSFPSAFEILVDFFVSSPAPDEQVAQVITQDVQVGHLGLLPAGIYSYTVNEIDVQRGTGIVTQAGSLSGTFAVVPEPSTLPLTLLGLCGLAVGRSVERRR